MLLSLLAALASAGCPAWTPDSEAEAARSPLVVVGTVRAVEVSGDAVLQHVEVARALKGTVRSGWITLSSAILSTGCPGTIVFPPGSRIVAVGAPDADGVVPIDPCRLSVTYDAGDGWAEEFARRDPSSAATFAGARPAAPVGAPRPFPTPGADRSRVARLGTIDVGGVTLTGDGAAAEIDGRVVSAGKDRVLAVWELEDLELAAWARVADLAIVPVRTVLLADGVRLAAGAAVELRGDEATYARDGIRVVGRVLAADRGVVWTPAALPQVDGGWSITRPVGWSARPGGPEIGTLAPEGSWTLTATGAPGSAAIPVRIGADGLYAEGWLPADAVVEGATGYGTGHGSLWGGSPTITLPAGTEIAAPSGGFARTTGQLTVPLLAEVGGRSWIRVATPWGEVVGSVETPPAP